MIKKNLSRKYNLAGTSETQKNGYQLRDEKNVKTLKIEAKYASRKSYGKMTPTVCVLLRRTQLLYSSSDRIFKKLSQTHKFCSSWQQKPPKKTHSIHLSMKYLSENYWFTTILSELNSFIFLNIFTLAVTPNSPLPYWLRGFPNKICVHYWMTWSIAI